MKNPMDLDGELPTSAQAKILMKAFTYTNALLHGKLETHSYSTH
jgi:hypothetical protein